MTDYGSLIKDDVHLKLFLTNLRKFEKLFTSFMVNGEDFNLKLEVRGNRDGIVHCRVSTDCFDRAEAGK